MTSDLQFEIEGITRSFNWLFPVAVIADWKARRLPGRFAAADDDDDDDDDALVRSRRADGMPDCTCGERRRAVTSAGAGSKPSASSLAHTCARAACVCRACGVCVCVCARMCVCMCTCPCRDHHVPPGAYLEAGSEAVAE